MSLKLSISGARGIVGESLTPEFILRLISAFSQYIPDGSVVIGMDTRSSGRPIGYVAMGTLCLLGRDVICIGVVPTPTIALCTKRLNSAGGIAITASHNPARWNALKLIDSNGLFLPPDFWDVFKQEGFEKPHWASHDKIGSASRREKCENDHIERILSLPYVDVAKIKQMRFRVAYDGVGGAGPAVMIPLLRELGADIIPIGHLMDGNFIHEPEPIAENLTMLSELVRQHGADIGFATDPDADRLAIVDEKGSPIGEEMTLALALEQVLSQSPGDIVINLSTSMLIDWVAKKFGKRVFRTPVGEYEVSKKMLEIGAIAGGEGNGGFILPQMHPVRDAATAAALILSLIARREQKVSQVVKEFPQRAMIKRKIEFKEDFSILSQKIMDGFALSEFDEQDGVRFETECGFVHIRPSNTEPVVRIIIDADNDMNAEKILAKVQKMIGNEGQ